MTDGTGEWLAHEPIENPVKIGISHQVVTMSTACTTPNRRPLTHTSTHNPAKHHERRKPASIKKRRLTSSHQTFFSWRFTPCTFLFLRHNNKHTHNTSHTQTSHIVEMHGQETHLPDGGGRHGGNSHGPVVKTLTLRHHGCLSPTGSWLSSTRSPCFEDKKG